jgi:hypothetical protein
MVGPPPSRHAMNQKTEAHRIRPVRVLVPIRPHRLADPFKHDDISPFDGQSSHAACPPVSLPGARKARSFGEA